MRTLLVLIAVIGVVFVGQTAWNLASAQAGAQGTAMSEADEARLEELMNIMAEEMETLRETENRREREALMETHREHMREAMALMSGMGGEMMGRMMEHMSMNESTQGAGRDRRHVHRRPMTRRSQMSDSTRLMDLETRVDMMQMMMESMLEQSDADE